MYPFQERMLIERIRFLSRHCMIEWTGTIRESFRVLIHDCYTMATIVCFQASTPGIESLFNPILYKIDMLSWRLVYIIKKYAHRILLMRLYCTKGQLFHYTDSDQFSRHSLRELYICYPDMSSATLWMQSTLAVVWRSAFHLVVLMESFQWISVSSMEITELTKTI